MKELDIEIIERDNNIPPERSILAKQTSNELHDAIKKVKETILEMNRPSPLFKIKTKRVYGETIIYKGTNSKEEK